MPLPIAGALGVAGWLSKEGFLGVAPERLRSRRKNKQMRQQFAVEAEAKAREGDQYAADILRQWAGLLPNGTVPARPGVWGGTTGAWGAWPGADGSKQLAMDAVQRLVSDDILTSSGKINPGMLAVNRRRAAERAVEQQRADEFAEFVGAQAVPASQRQPRYDPYTGQSVRATTTRQPRYDPYTGQPVPAGTTTRGSGGRGRAATRYDPLTGRKYKVYPDDPRYDEWPSRKPSKRALQEARGEAPMTRTQRTRVRTARRQIEQRITNAGLVATAGAVGKFTSMAAAAGLSPAAAAALVVSVGLISYGATTAIMNAVSRARDPAVKREKIALAYRKSRTDLAAQQGRALTRTEHQMLAEWFKDQMRQAGYGSYLGGVS